MAKDRLYYMQFHPADWLRDSSLRACSSGARGLWIDMLCLMWDCVPRGFLQTPNGDGWTTEMIARSTGNISVQDVAEWLGELETCGVLSRTDNSARVIFSRRMQRDEQVRQTNSKNGKKGGNPSLKRGVKRGVNRDSNRNGTQLELESKSTIYTHTARGDPDSFDGSLPTDPPDLIQQKWLEFRAAWAKCQAVSDPTWGDNLFRKFEALCLKGGFMEPIFKGLERLAKPLPNGRLVTPYHYLIQEAFGDFANGTHGWLRAVETGLQRSAGKNPQGMANLTPGVVATNSKLAAKIAAAKAARDGSDGGSGKGRPGCDGEAG